MDRVNSTPDIFYLHPSSNLKQNLNKQLVLRLVYILTDRKKDYLKLQNRNTILYACAHTHWQKGNQGWEPTGNSWSFLHWKAAHFTTHFRTREVVFQVVLSLSPGRSELSFGNALLCHALHQGHVHLGWSPRTRTDGGLQGLRALGWKAQQLEVTPRRKHNKDDGVPRRRLP